jgi:hypothetical protein
MRGSSHIGANIFAILSDLVAVHLEVLLDRFEIVAVVRQIGDGVFR